MSRAAANEWPFTWDGVRWVLSGRVGPEEAVYRDTREPVSLAAASHAERCGFRMWKAGNRMIVAAPQNTERKAAL